MFSKKLMHFAKSQKQSKPAATSDIDNNVSIL
jgi:hypothetical protein